MKIVEKNQGPKIAYSTYGTKLTLNEEMTLDLAKYERDFEVNIDICRNNVGFLTFGISERYVAQINIPQRQYTVSGTGEEQTQVAVPLDMKNVTLTLWSVEE